MQGDFRICSAGSAEEVASKLKRISDAERQMTAAYRTVADVDELMRAEAKIHSSASEQRTLQAWLKQRRAFHSKLAALSAADQHALHSLEELLLATIQNATSALSKSPEEGQTSSVKHHENSRRRQAHNQGVVNASRFFLAYLIRMLSCSPVVLELSRYCVSKQDVLRVSASV